MMLHILVAMILASMFRISVANNSCKEGWEQAPKKLCEIIKGATNECWGCVPSNSWKEGVSCSIGVCDPSNEPLENACMGYAVNTTLSCRLGNDRKIRVASKLRGNNNLQDLLGACNTFAVMCAEWAPRFKEAKAKGVAFDCNTFAEETDRHWRGVCLNVVNFNPAWKLENLKYEANGFRKRYKEESTDTYWLEMPDGKYTQEMGAGRERRLI
jgi:hypothetical protein